MKYILNTSYYLEIQHNIFSSSVYADGLFKTTNDLKIAQYVSLK
jgi:hypothetical protein